METCEQQSGCRIWPFPTKRIASIGYFRRCWSARWTMIVTLFTNYPPGELEVGRGVVDRGGAFLPTALPSVGNGRTGWRRTGDGMPATTG